MAIKKSRITKASKAVKGRVSKAAIGAPSGNDGDTSTPSLPSNPIDYTPSTPTSTGPRYEMPKSYGEKFEPVGIPNDNEWHHDEQHVVSEHMLNYGKHPMDVVRYWTQNNGEHLKNAQPYDPQHGDYSGFDFNAPDWTKTSKEYQDAIKHPGYVGDVGQSAPKSTPTKKPKPSGDQHASYSPGSYSAPSSAETIRYMPGSMSAAVGTSRTDRDKYKY